MLTSLQTNLKIMKTQRPTSILYRKKMTVLGIFIQLLVHERLAIRKVFFSEAPPPQPQHVGGA